jgi:hypothetical protein
MVYTNLTNHEHNLPVVYDSSWKTSKDRIQAKNGKTLYSPGKIVYKEVDLTLLD